MITEKNKADKKDKDKDKKEKEKNEKSSVIAFLSQISRKRIIGE